MNAAEVAKRAGIGKDTLRYYEKIGLISPPPRSANGYRAYNPTVLDELRFIKLGQSVGFTLGEIKPAIPFVRDPRPGCPLLTKALVDQVERVDEKIAELEQAKATLQRWLIKLASQQVSNSGA